MADGVFLPAIAFQTECLDALPRAGFTPVSVAKQVGPFGVVGGDVFQPISAFRVVRLTPRSSLDFFIGQVHFVPFIGGGWEQASGLVAVRMDPDQPLQFPIPPGPGHTHGLGLGKYTWVAAESG